MKVRTHPEIFSAPLYENLITLVCDYIARRRFCSQRLGLHRSGVALSGQHLLARLDFPYQARATLR